MTSSFLVATGTAAQDDALTRYNATFGAVSTRNNTVEADVQTSVREAGTFKNLFTYVSSNSMTANTTYTLRKSAADTALIVTYTSGQTGVKEDTSNTVSFAATDEAAWEITTAAVGGTRTIVTKLIACEFVPDSASNCVCFVGATHSLFSTATASTTRYLAPSGESTAHTATEANVLARFLGTFTASDLFVNVSSNARTTDTIYRTRKNGANGGQSVTYTSGQTGQKEDTSGTDSLASGDDFNFAFVTSTGSGTISCTTIHVSMTSTASLFVHVSGEPSGSKVVGFGQTEYYGISGSFSTISIEAEVQAYPRFTFSAKQFGSLATANTVNGDSTFTLRDDGADSSAALVYSTTQTGLKSDTSTTVTITSGTDEVNWRLVTGGSSGLLTFTWISLIGEVPAAPSTVLKDIIMRGGTVPRAR